MGLLIKSTTEKVIKIAGTQIELNDIYGRVEFAGRINGVTLDFSIYTFVSKQGFENKQVLFTDIENTTFSVDLQPGEIQDLDTALIYSKLAFEQLGYSVDILND